MRLLYILLEDKILKKCLSDIKIHEFAEHSLYDTQTYDAFVFFCSYSSVYYTTHKLTMLLCSSVHIRVFDKNFERWCVIRMFSNFERKFECSNLIRMLMYEI